MKPIFDRNGDVIAWRENCDIYDNHGEHVAIINEILKIVPHEVIECEIYNNQGQHIGTFNRGLILDKKGGLVAFVQGSTTYVEPPLPDIVDKNPSPPALTKLQREVVPDKRTEKGGFEFPTFKWGLSWPELLTDVDLEAWKNNPLFGL